MTEQYIEDLIRKYAEGTASDDEVQKLMEWYRLSLPEDVSWPTSYAAEKEDLFRRMLGRLKNQISPKPERVVAIRWMRAAAILIIGFGLLAAYILFKPTSDRYISFNNPSGKIQLITLPDSSKVWLNANTTIWYSNSFKTSRTVKLQGEAYFDVIHDPGRPFRIEGGEVQTTVLGTTFNVKAYRASSVTIVTVVTGKVKVEHDSKLIGLLTASSQLRYDRQNKTGTTVPVETAAVLAWKDGRLAFHGETLGEILHALENWYGVSFQLSNSKIKDCRYYMSFDNTSTLEKILSAIAEIADIKYQIDSKQNIVHITGNSCE